MPGRSLALAMIAIALQTERAHAGLDLVFINNSHSIMAHEVSGKETRLARVLDDVESREMTALLEYPRNNVTGLLVNATALGANSSPKSASKGLGGGMGPSGGGASGSFANVTSAASTSAPASQTNLAMRIDNGPSSTTVSPLTGLLADPSVNKRFVTTDAGATLHDPASHASTHDPSGKGHQPRAPDKPVNHPVLSTPEPSTLASLVSGLVTVAMGTVWRRHRSSWGGRDRRLATCER